MMLRLLRARELRLFQWRRRASKRAAQAPVVVAATPPMFSAPMGRPVAGAKTFGESGIAAQGQSAQRAPVMQCYPGIGARQRAALRDHGAIRQGDDQPAMLKLP
jgi:hypothetical protein